MNKQIKRGQTFETEKLGTGVSGSNAILIGTTLLSMATLTPTFQEAPISFEASDYNNTEQISGEFYSHRSEIETETNDESSELELLNRYNQISKSEWFIKTYHNKSIGQVVGLES